MDDRDFLFNLYYNYSVYKEHSLKHVPLKHSDLIQRISNLNTNIFSNEILGYSVESRSIHMISFGKGKKVVFLWSQMHGDEPTATLALLDLFNFINANDHFKKFKESLFNELTISICPMVNPDGAEKNERRNAQQIDLNRDTENPQSPEGKILKDAMNKLKADFSFNLHDQSSFYGVGKSNQSAAISFLAPPYDIKKSINLSRTKAIKLIGFLNSYLELLIPGHIAKYNDDYEPRAFGDYSQSIGSSTILIESGYLPGDSNKIFIRKLNFIILVLALKSIMETSYSRVPSSIYDNIPFNKESFFDVIVRSVKLHRDRQPQFTVDIALNKNKDGDFLIMDIGDLTGFYGHDEYDASTFESFQFNDNLIIGNKIGLSFYKGDNLKLSLT